MYVCVRERISRSVFEESGRLRLPCKEPLRLLPLISPTHTLSFRDIHHAHIKDTRTHSRIICHSDLLGSSVTCSDLPCSPSLITEAVLFLGYRFTLASQDSPAILLSPTSLPLSSAPSRAFVSVSQHNQTAQTTKHNWAVKICFFRTYVCGTPFNVITQTGLRNLFFPSSSFLNHPWCPTNKKRDVCTLGELLPFLSLTSKAERFVVTNNTYRSGL